MKSRRGTKTLASVDKTVGGGSAATATDTAVGSAAVGSAAVGEQLSPVLEPAPPASVRKTRVKKTPPVVAVVSPAGVSGSFLNEQRPLIAHIPVTSAQVEFETGPGGTERLADIPKPYDETQANDSYAFLESNCPLPEREDIPVADLGVPPPPFSERNEIVENPPKSKIPNNYSEKLMVLFQDSNRMQSLPTKTDIACFWCCHSFQTAPFAIPSHILDEVWFMYGNFCSAECAAAYLLKEKIDSHVHWERYALLNSLYSDDARVPIGAPHGIRPAPPREVLRMFGGSMDISEYRSIVHEKRLRIDVLTPPMVSIIQTMDTKPIDFYDQNLKNVFIRNDIQHKYHAPGAQGLRLRRTKPVKARESTVEWAMRIQVLDTTNKVEAV
jgi:hypothetical protein